ncbi:lipopolysaccharide export system protein LptC [Litoreibacter ponti]|uniref:Lipopolysaccharide export system protein LptC n=1 Tax=Litoreibacter ponti TaxID=1510457 RepID=A0A2T6BPD6_9RHOB|nr:LPS export ABC transporter periplasmic protein LptC [Litoreibacter ponti]PTX57912.1 lipopolysaccharide export system protein LptC [Litoreibacter ponti]
MARRIDNRYSRFVQWAKVIFPLAALGLLSTLFLFSRTIDPSDAIPFADIDVEQIARDQVLSSPRFSGATDDGTAITVDAASAVPDLTDPRRMNIEEVVARIESPNGRSYGITSLRARYDGNTETLELNGDVRIGTSNGYRLETETLTTNLQTSAITAPGKVFGKGPPGIIEAGAMELTGQDGTQVLVFKNGVKLIYDPKE